MGFTGGRGIFYLAVVLRGHKCWPGLLYRGRGRLAGPNTHSIIKANKRCEHMYDISALSSLPGPGSNTEHMNDSLNTTLANRLNRTSVCYCVMLKRLTIQN